MNSTDSATATAGGLSKTSPVNLSKRERVAWRIVQTLVWLVIRKRGPAKWSIRPPLANARLMAVRNSLRLPRKRLEFPEEIAS